MRKARLQMLSEKLLAGSFKLQFIALLIFTITIVVLGSLLVVLLWEYRFGEALWWAFLRITDPGNLSYDTASPVRVVGSAVAILGWVVFGLLISIISTAIQARLSELQKGRSRIHYKNHTVVLGWNQTIFSVLDELVFFQAEGDPPVVVMAEKSTEEMYSQINSYCKKETVKKVFCRTGNPESVADQKIVNIHWACKVIVLSSYLEKGSFSADAATLKTALAYNKNIIDHEESKDELLCKEKANIVLEISQPLYLKYIEGIMSSGENNSRVNHYPVVTTDIIGKILAACALQPGLSYVYNELFSYFSYLQINGSGTSEIYIMPLADIGFNKPVHFDDLLYGFDNAIAIGYRKNGKNLVVNPHEGNGGANVLLAPEDSVIYIADTREAFQCNQKLEEPSFNIEFRENPEANERKNVLVIGNGFKAVVVVNTLFSFLAAGSKVSCSDSIKEKIEVDAAKAGLTLNTIPMDNVDDLVQKLNSGEVVDFDLVIFADEVEDTSSYDARLLMCLAGINTAFKNNKPRIVMELFESSNVELAQTAHAEDVIIGTELLSNYLVQIADSPERHQIYAELLTYGETEIYIKPVDLYRNGQQSISFRELMIAAHERKEIAIGFAWEENGKYKHMINPHLEFRFEKDPRIQRAIVLAEDVG